MTLGNRSWDEWIAQYGTSHRNEVNRVCHTIGIPIIVASLLLVPFFPLDGDLWRVALLLFCTGWALQFIGHAFEGKPPEFLNDWRFLLVGLRWWVAKLKGRA